MNVRHSPPFHTAAFRMLALAAVGAVLLGPAQAAGETPQGQTPAQAAGSPPAGADGAEDLSRLLPVLLTSSERKQLAAELEAAIRRGDLQTAEGKLNTAIEMGTLAIVLIDRLHDPKLLQALQEFGLKGGDQPPRAPDAGAESADAARLRELQAALAQEQALNGALAQELAALRQEHRSLAER